MCDPVTATIAAVSAVASAYQGSKMASAQKKAAGQADKNSKAAAAQADQDYNAAHGKTPNVQGIQDQQATAALSGSGSTMLTGSGGVDPTQLTLGKSTLLGQ
jgi:regulator of protease activity HflC (stomatin/prohibitin superfamily)